MHRKTINHEEQQYRHLLATAKRIVVKVGTGVLIDENIRPNRLRIANIVKQLAFFHKAGKELVLVSSGAIGAGLNVLGMKQRPNALPELQMAAAVGQTRLLEIYSHFFSEAGCCISQILLTHADLKHRNRHLNARNTMLTLLSHRVIPIVNENDVVAVDEICIGDNDLLSSLVTVLIDADLLIMLTSPDGLRESIASNKTRRVNYLSGVTAKTFELVNKKTESLSSGGMSTKLKAAQTASEIGALVVIASGLEDNTIVKLMQGEDIGTLIVPSKLEQDKLGKRKRWIRYFHRPEGQLIIDAGAQQAVQVRGKSLLPVGIKRVQGLFETAALVEICDEYNRVIGRGLVEYSSSDIDKIKGRSSVEISKLLGYAPSDKVISVVIHRNNMITEMSDGTG